MLPSQLSPQQLARFEAAAAEQQTTVERLAADFRPDPWMDGSIVGVLPHCGLYGLMEPDGRCHT